ncbi:SA1002 family membrane protein [Stomatohabitans albus]|uniref:SA1002 family membrane protein n=1 Tax=Stomatohabitans albus TaxID=3110766 RepID=UPI00300D9FF9
MINLIQIIGIITIFYFIDLIINRGKEGKSRFRFLYIAINFIIMVVAGAISVVLAAIPIGGSALLIDGYLELIDGIFHSKFNSTSFLLMIFIIVFVAGIIQFYLRLFMINRGWLKRLGSEDIEIIEYFIQWSTIYLAVYQFMFDGINQVFSEVIGASTAKDMFQVILTPRNINLAMQPILISTWIAVVIEKLRQRRLPEQVGAE